MTDVAAPRKVHEHSTGIAVCLCKRPKKNTLAASKHSQLGFQVPSSILSAEIATGFVRPLRKEDKQMSKSCAVRRHDMHRSPNPETPQAFGQLSYMLRATCNTVFTALHAPACKSKLISAALQLLEAFSI